MKKTLILIPGLSYNKDLWKTVIDTVKKEYDCKVLLVEHDHLDEIVSFVLKKAPEHFCIAGHSIGAWASLAVAAKAKKRVEKLVVIGGWARPNPNVKEFLTGMIKEVQGGHLDVFQSNLRSAAIYEKAKNKDRIDEMVKKMQKDMKKELYITQAKAIINDMDITKRLPEITADTLIVHNEFDGFFSLEEAQYLKEHIPHAKLQIIKGVGHMSLLEKPDEMAQIVAKFLTK